MKAIVMGAGIGGLAATISLQQAGVEVVLLEQAPHFGEVGAGIQLAPNATRELGRLGLLEAARAVSANPDHLSFLTWSNGREICRYSLGTELEAEFGAPYLQVHRADLHSMLVRAVPAGSVRLGTVVTGLGQDSARAWVDTADGERITADFVVAADGIRSLARQWLFGEDQPVYSGTAAYRALLPAADVADLDLPPNASWIGPGRHFVNYTIRDGELLNVVAVVQCAESGSESWNAEAAPGEALREFGGWDPRVTAVLERAGTILRWGIYTRAAQPRWNVGRVTLLGDSAHAMVPFQAQGAAQAIVDAAVLGQQIARGADDVPAALERYVLRRLAMATSAQSSSKQAGESFHLADGPEADGRNERMAAHAAQNAFSPMWSAWAEDTDDDQPPTVAAPATAS